MLKTITWNINAGFISDKEALFDKPNVLEQSAKDIGETLRVFDPSIVALQEIPFTNKNSESFIAEIADASGLTHFYSKAASPSHIHDNETTYIGLAILSKYPIKKVTFHELTNPKIKITLPNEKKEISHDRIILEVIINIGEFDIKVFNIHLLPWRRLNRLPNEPIFSLIADEVSRIINDDTTIPKLILGDINTNSLNDLFNDYKKLEQFREHIQSPTTDEGYLSDQVITSKHFKFINGQYLPTLSDHFICFCQLEFQNCNLPEERQNKESLSLIKILHLTDMHFGEGSQEDTEWKVFVEGAERENRAFILADYLKALTPKPDIVVISGDTTIAGRKSGFNEAKIFLEEQIKLANLPPHQHIIIVPGNHDVSRSVWGQSVNQEKRWKNFKEFIGPNFIRPWLDGDPTPDQFEISSILEENTIGGAIPISSSKGLETTLRLPFYFDRKKKILIYAFNSASVSGTFLEVNKNILLDLQNLKKYSDDKYSLLAEKIENEIKNIAAIDPARIQPSEIRVFRQFMQLLKNEIDDWDGILKIAVLHHHLSAMYSEEVKQFELLINAGHFKKIIQEEGITVVMHGHKHFPDVFYDSSSLQADKLLMISGGTIGGGTTSNKEPGFFNVDYNKQEQSISTNYIPLDPITSPDEVIQFSQEKKTKFKVKLKSESANIFNNHENTKEKNLTFSDLIKKIISKLEDNIQLPDTIHNEKNKCGWNNHFLRPGITPYATVFGLAVVEELGEIKIFPDNTLRSIIETILNFRRQNGGWSASSQGEPGQPTETALTVRVLNHYKHQFPELISQQDLLSTLESLLVDINIFSTFLISESMNALVDISIESHFLKIFDISIKANVIRSSSGEIMGWPDTIIRTPLTPPINDLSTKSNLSVSGSAYIIISMLKLNKASNGVLGYSAEELSSVAKWLNDQNWISTTEELIQLEKKKLLINHETSIICSLALLELGFDAAKNKIQSNVKSIIKQHLENIDNEEPIWGMYNFIRLLKAYSLHGNIFN